MSRPRPEGYWETGGDSWPSLTNSVNGADGPESGSAEDGGEGVPESLEELAGSVEELRRSSFGRRAVAVSPDRKLRSEAVRDDGDRARSVAGTTKQFLLWLREQEGSQLVYQNEEGETVKGDLPTSYSEGYADKQYATLKDFERAFCDLAANPHTAMLTLTQSTENANGHPRCPGDHLRELQESWTDTVYHSLRNALRREGFGRFELPESVESADDILPSHLPEKWWEYAVVMEPHPESGYIHAHVAVFLDAGPDTVDRETFRPVMESHVERLPGAGSEAHQVAGEDRAVSVASVDLDSGPSGAEIGNLGSYVSEYIAGYGEAMEERPAREAAGYAMIWATGSQRVRFSKGGNQLARVGQLLRKGPEEPTEGEWTVKEIERPDGSTHPPETGGGPEFYRIDGAPSADPVKEVA